MTQDYPLFVHWSDTLDWILTTIERFPKNARFSLASRISDAALDTIEIIIETIYTKDRLPKLNKINLFLEKQRVFFRIAHKRRYISNSQFEYIAKAINEAGRMTGGWRKKIIEKNQ